MRVLSFNESIARRELLSVLLSARAQYNRSSRIQTKKIGDAIFKSCAARVQRVHLLFFAANIMQSMKKKSEREKREQLRICVEKFALRLSKHRNETDDRFALNSFQISRADASLNKTHRLKQRVRVLMLTNAMRVFDHLSPCDRAFEKIAFSRST